MLPYQVYILTNAIHHADTSYVLAQLSQQSQSLLPFEIRPSPAGSRRWPPTPSATSCPTSSTPRTTTSRTPTAQRDPSAAATSSSWILHRGGFAWKEKLFQGWLFYLNWSECCLKDSYLLGNPHSTAYQSVSIQANRQSTARQQCLGGRRSHRQYHPPLTSLH